VSTQRIVGLVFFTFILPLIEGIYAATHGWTLSEILLITVLTCSVPNLIIWYGGDESPPTITPHDRSSLPSPAFLYDVRKVVAPRTFVPDTCHKTADFICSSCRRIEDERVMQAVHPWTRPLR